MQMCGTCVRFVLQQAAGIGVWGWWFPDTSAGYEEHLAWFSLLMLGHLQKHGVPCWLISQLGLGYNHSWRDTLLAGTCACIILPHTPAHVCWSHSWEVWYISGHLTAPPSPPQAENLAESSCLCLQCSFCRGNVLCIMVARRSTVLLPPSSQPDRPLLCFPISNHGLSCSGPSLRFYIK